MFERWHEKKRGGGKQSAFIDSPAVGSVGKTAKGTALSSKIAALHSSPVRTASMQRDSFPDLEKGDKFVAFDLAVPILWEKADGISSNVVWVGGDMHALRMLASHIGLGMRLMLGGVASYSASAGSKTVSPSVKGVELAGTLLIPSFVLGKQHVYFCISPAIGYTIEYMSSEAAKVFGMLGGVGFDATFIFRIGRKMGINVGLTGMEYFFGFSRTSTDGADSGFVGLFDQFQLTPSIGISISY